QLVEHRTENPGVDSSILSLAIEEPHNGEIVVRFFFLTASCSLEPVLPCIERRRPARKDQVHRPYKGWMHLPCHALPASARGITLVSLAPSHDPCHDGPRWIVSDRESVQRMPMPLRHALVVQTQTYCKPSVRVAPATCF